MNRAMRYPSLNVTFAAQAQSDLAVVYSGLVSRGVSRGTPIGSALGSTTRYPGVYTNPMYLVNGAQITLDAQGDPNAVFVFVRSVGIAPIHSLWERPLVSC
jgi:hypothetical protein